MSKHTISIMEVNNLIKKGVTTFSRKDDSPRGCRVVSASEIKIGDVNCFQLYRRSDETIDIYLDDEFISNKPDIHAAEIYVKNFDYARLYQNVDMVS